MSIGDKIRVTTQTGQSTHGQVEAIMGDRMWLRHRPRWTAAKTMISSTEYIYTDDGDYCDTAGELVTIETMEPADEPAPEVQP